MCALKFKNVHKHILSLKSAEERGYPASAEKKNNIPMMKK